MDAFKLISEEEIADAAFLAGLLTPISRTMLVPLPVKVDGLPTVAFCVRAEPVGHEGLKILHPVAIVPHGSLLIQDMRDGRNTAISRSRILPIDSRHAKLYRAALNDPSIFFGAWADGPDKQ